MGHQALAERSRLFDILLEAAFDQDETTTDVSWADGAF